MRISNNRWNLTRHAGRIAGADGYVVSVPKSGRTWLRVFVQAYCCRLQGIDFSLDSWIFSDSPLPYLYFTHDLYEQVTERNLWARLRGKHLIPAAPRRSKPVILLVRDPRDVVVSLYYQLTRRERKKRVSMALDELVMHRRHGIGTIISVMNRWWRDWGRSANAMLFKYEALHANPREEFARLLNFIGFDSIDSDAFEHALTASTFDTMQKRESQGGYESEILRPGEAQSPNSYKVRRGVVGGYRDELDDKTLAYVNRRLRDLNPAFGYTPE